MQQGKGGVLRRPVRHHPRIRRYTCKQFVGYWPAARLSLQDMLYKRQQSLLRSCLSTCQLRSLCMMMTRSRLKICQRRTVHTVACLLLLQTSLLSSLGKDECQKYFSLSRLHMRNTPAWLQSTPTQSQDHIQSLAQKCSPYRGRQSPSHPPP